jgi:hypothetical protein
MSRLLWVTAEISTPAMSRKSITTNIALDILLDFPLWLGSLLAHLF